MTENQKAMIEALSHCTFLPGSFEKRYVCSMTVYSKKDLGLSEKQAEYLGKLFHMYRKQIGKIAHEAYCPACNADRDPAEAEDDYEFMAIHQIGGGFTE